MVLLRKSIPQNHNLKTAAELGVRQQMKLLSISLIATMLLVGCASSRLADEPADLIAPGRSVLSLTHLGWAISEPISVADAEAKDHLLPESLPSGSGKPWKSFVAKLAPGDALSRLLKYFPPA